MRDFILYSYGDDVVDQTSLRTSFNTNKGYKGLTHPCVSVEGGGYVPDFQHRCMRRFPHSPLPGGCTVNLCASVRLNARKAPQLTRGAHTADLTEDIPTGLVVIKGIALLAGVETPRIDSLLYWCQERIGEKMADRRWCCNLRVQAFSTYVSIFVRDGNIIRFRGKFLTFRFPIFAVAVTAQEKSISSTGSSRARTCTRRARRSDTTSRGLTMFSIRIILCASL